MKTFFQVFICKFKIKSYLCRAFEKGIIPSSVAQLVRAPDC